MPLKNYVINRQVIELTHAADGGVEWRGQTSIYDDFVIGVYATCEDNYYNKDIQLEINGREIFPEKFPAFFLLNNRTKQFYYKFKERAKGSPVRIKVTQNASAPVRTETQIQVVILTQRFFDLKSALKGELETAVDLKKISVHEFMANNMQNWIPFTFTEKTLTKITDIALIYVGYITYGSRYNNHFIKLDVKGKEILPAEFNAALICPSEFSAIDDFKYPVNIQNVLNKNVSGKYWSRYQNYLVKLILFGE